MANRSPPSLTEPEVFDAIVIGTGQSGPSLAARLADAGKKTAILERKLLGGTCVNDGCIPTKTLIASALAAHVARRCAEFGVEIGGPVRVDMATVKARKDTIVKKSVAGVTDWIGKRANLELIHGQGRFEAAHRVRVGERVLSAPQIFIDTGVRASVPKIAGLDDVAFLTNTGMMEVDVLPEHLVIVGGSYIGLEFAQMYRRFGSRVTVIEKGPRLIARENDAVSEAIRLILEGDGRGAFTHTSYNGYEIVAAKSVRRRSAPGQRPYCGPRTFHRSAARARRHDGARGARLGTQTLAPTMPMSRVGRAAERSETAGFMKIVVDAETKKILGAALLGIEGDEVIHSILDVMYAGAPYRVMSGKTARISASLSLLPPALRECSIPSSHIDIWYESEARLAEASGVDGADCSRFVTSHLEIHCRSVSSQADMVDLKLRVGGGSASYPRSTLPFS